MANTRIRDGFNTHGASSESTIDHDGPTLYDSGGELIAASVFGLKLIDQVIVSGSNDGTYFCAVRFTKKGGGNGSFYLVWYVSATGAEAGAIDLHASFVRITAIGR